MLARGQSNQTTQTQPSPGRAPADVALIPGGSVQTSSNALPVGASTEAKQDDELAALGTLNTTLGTPAQVPVAVTLTHTTVTTSTTTSLALAANSSAKYRLFQNADATDSISIAFGVAAVANTQIVLFPKEKMEFSLALGNMDTRIVNCIASANTPKLLVTQGV